MNTNIQLKNSKPNSNNKTTVWINGNIYETLTDILPLEGDLNILFVGKTPTLVSVKAGHYFQGRQGKMFWNKLSHHSILNVPFGQYEDDYLLSNNYGITDIVKIPRSYGKEPSHAEYEEGLNRIIPIIEKHKPKIIIFVYKKVLDKVLKIKLGSSNKSIYGFNPQFRSLFYSEVFVFPMPGTPCRSELAIQVMNELRMFLDENRDR